MKAYKAKVLEKTRTTEGLSDEVIAGIGWAAAEWKDYVVLAEDFDSAFRMFEGREIQSIVEVGEVYEGEHIEKPEKVLPW